MVIVLRFIAARGWALGSLRALLAIAWLTSCGVLNDPNPPGSAATNTEFTAFLETTPKHLDPTSAYVADEAPITYAVYEPPYRYNYLKRPYVLEGRAALEVTAPYDLDAAGRRVDGAKNPDAVAQSIYEIHLRRGILYAPHPAFARDATGARLYDRLQPKDLDGKYAMSDFDRTGSRELVAADYVYAIKRLATPRVKSPVYSVFAQHIIGLTDLAERLKRADQTQRAGLLGRSRDLPWLDLRQFPLEGVDAPDDYTLRIRLNGRYPQFKYWLATTFFSPIPWEAEQFYAQPGMADHNFSLNFWPVGTGPYMLTRYLENRALTLRRNPNFRGEPYPCEGSESDRAAGLLQDCGHMMPFIDRVEMVIEKERIPLKNKFVEGFYDEPDLVHPEFGIEFAVEERNSDARAQELNARGLRFPREVDPDNWYIGFNWWDPVVGKGNTPEQQVRNRKLRQALQIAVDWEEFSQVFERKGGEAAMGPLPPGIFGYRSGQLGMDPIAYDWIDGHAQRKSLAEAKKLLAEAGYPEGRDAKTGQPLVINYDYQRIPTPEYKSEIEWVIKQFAKLGIQLEVRATDYNRFQDKMDAGSAQMFWWGWQADYPDAENFMFLLYGPAAKAATHGNGENATNYQNDEYDKLFVQMRLLDDGPAKQAILDRMVAIVQQDSPWLWGYNPYAAGAYHNWMSNAKPTTMIKDILQYRRIDPQLRVRELARWNQPIIWPLWLMLLALVVALWPAWQSYRARERAHALPSASATRGFESPAAKPR